MTTIKQGLRAVTITSIKSCDNTIEASSLTCIPWSCQSTGCCRGRRGILRTGPPGSGVQCARSLHTRRSGTRGQSQTPRRAGPAPGCWSQCSSPAWPGASDDRVHYKIYQFVKMDHPDPMMRIRCDVDLATTRTGILKIFEF